MHTLVRELEDNTTSYFTLGESYSVIKKESVSKEEWDRISRDYWGEAYQSAKTGDRVPERDCTGFVIGENGTWHFLLPWQKNFIITKSTFNI